MPNASKDDLILDFFAGSGTTAHAVMALNANDEGNRRFISIQIPEQTSQTSEAYELGFENIYELTKERLSRASKKLEKNTLILMVIWDSKYMKQSMIFVQKMSLNLRCLTILF